MLLLNAPPPSSLPLRQSFKFTEEWTSALPKGIEDRAARTLTLASALFCVVVGLSGLVYYPFVIHNLNASVKRNRTLLMLVPGEVISGVKTLKEDIAALTKRLNASSA